MFVLVSRLDPYDMVDSGEYDSAARHLLAGQGFIAGLDKTFIRPPAYSLLVAVSYALGGVGVLAAIQIVLSAATAVLVGVVARYLRPGPLVAPVAGLVAAFYPWTFAYVGGLASETLFTFLWVAATVLLLRAAGASGGRAAAAAGAVFGLAGLTRSNLLVLGPGLALWFLWRARSPIRPFLYGLAVLAVVLPFTAYQLAQGNGLMLGSNGGGMSFYIGNNPGQTALYADRLGSADWLKSTFINAEGEAFLDCPGLRCLDTMPMAERDGFFYRAGLRYIATAPLDALVTDLRKVFHYWRPWAEPRIYSPAIVAATGASVSVVIVLAVLGLRRMTRQSAAFVLTIVTLGTLTVALWHVQLRYRIALVDPLLLAAAGIPLADWLARSRARPIAAARQFMLGAGTAI